jgi:hypothetical protein
MHKLVPKEKAEVAKDDRFPMSQGLKMFVGHYGFDVEPEMVSSMVGVLHYTIAYVLCTYNPLFLTDQSLGFKFSK